MDKKLLDALMLKIIIHTEHWKKVNGYDDPYDYRGLQYIMEKYIREYLSVVYKR